jgi:hypothetical protein
MQVLSDVNPIRDKAIELNLINKTMNDHAPGKTPEEVGAVGMLNRSEVWGNEPPWMFVDAAKLRMEPSSRLHIFIDICSSAVPSSISTDGNECAKKKKKKKKNNKNKKGKNDKQVNV